MWGQEGKANLTYLWFVLKCRSNPAVILRPFRIGSEPQPSQPIVYVCFDRAYAIEPLLVNVKYTYQVNSSWLVTRVERWAPPSLLVQNRSYACASRLPLALRRRNQPGRIKPPGCFILSRFGFYRPGTFITQMVRGLRMCSIAFPAGLGLAVVVC